MSMIYTHSYKVGTWIVLEEIKGKRRQNYVLKSAQEAGAHFLQWPGQTFSAHLLSYRKKGYAQHLPTQYPFAVDTALLLRACSEHIKNSISPTSYLSGGTFSMPAHRIDRRVTSEADFEKLFNDILSLEDDIGLSQIFRLGELNTNAFVTFGPVPKKLLTRLATRVITVGDEPNNDIVVGDLKEESEFQEAFNKFFTGE